MAVADTPTVLDGASWTSSVETSRSWQPTTIAPASVGARMWNDVSSSSSDTRVTSLGSTSSKACRVISDGGSAVSRVALKDPSKAPATAEGTYTGRWLSKQSQVGDPREVGARKDGAVEDRDLKIGVAPRQVELGRRDELRRDDRPRAGVLRGVDSRVRRKRPRTYGRVKLNLTRLR
jgi:hypothetical protein